MTPAYRRKLQKELRETERHAWEVASQSTPEVRFYDGGMPYRRRLKRLIARYDSYVLEKKAARYGVEMPTRPDWFDTEIDTLEGRLMIEENFDVPDGFDPLSSDTPKTTPEIELRRLMEGKLHKWLNETGRAMVAKQIRDARFTYWKGWADLLIPILALAIAFLALFKDIVIEIVKRI